MLLAPAEMIRHFAAGWGNLVADVAVVGSIALLRRFYGLGEAVFWTCGVTLSGSADVIAGVVCFVLADGDAL